MRPAMMYDLKISIIDIKKMDRLSLFLKKNTFITYGTPNLMRRRHRKKLGQRRPWWSGG